MLDAMVAVGNAVLAFLLTAVGSTVALWKRASDHSVLFIQLIANSTLSHGVAIGYIHGF